MLDIYTWSVLITGIFYTSFGIFAYVKNRELSTRLFTFVSITFAVWSFSWFLLLKTNNPESAIVFAKLLTFGATFIPIFYLHWALSIVDLHKKRKVLLFFGYIITLVFSVLSFTDLYISGVRKILFFSFWPIAGPAFTLFIFVGYFGMVLYALVELIKGYRNNTGDKKYQIGYLILGTILGFGGGATNFPLMYGISVMQPFGIFLTMASPFIFSYAAVKYKFMDIKVVATQFFAGAINIIFIINIILSDTYTALFFNIFLFAFVLVFTILLIRGVRNEILQREKIERLAQNLAEANEKLKELDQLKSEFLSMATHQIRAPLTAIKGYSSMLLDGDFGILPQKAIESVQTIMKSCQNLINIVGDFLNISRIEQGRMVYEKSIFDMRELVKEVANELKPNIQNAGLSLELEIPEKLGANVNADRDKIKQVIGNVIDNAIKYTPKGGIKLSVFIDKEKVKVAIQDSGVGIDPEETGKLFNKFSRAKDANETNVTGTGLGLYIAKKMTEAHRGDIKVFSKGVGEGTTFTIELPMHN
jgi:signal transduction histidine kinase